MGGRREGGRVRVIRGEEGGESSSSSSSSSKVVVAVERA